MLTRPHGIAGLVLASTHADLGIPFADTLALGAPEDGQ